MDNTDKLQKLAELSEAELRRDLLIPLLGRMQYQAATEYHGPREHGKDIVCFEIDRLQDRRYLGVVAKVGDLTGSASDRNGLMTVLNQTEQCFNEPYFDLFGMRAVTMHEVWIVTAGRVVPGAAESVKGRLQKYNLDKLTRIISGTQLVELVDRHYPTFWGRAIESPENVRGQRDRHRDFLAHLLNRLGGNPHQIADVIATIENSTRLPNISVEGSSRWHLTWASSYSVDLERVVDAYPRGMVGQECGHLYRAFNAARREIRSSLYEIEETLDEAERVLKEADPHAFVRAVKERLRGRYPFSEKWGRGREALSEIFYLEAGLDEADNFLARVDAAGQRESFVRVVEAIDSLASQMQEYIRGVDSDEFTLTWELTDSGVSVRYESDPEAEVGGFQTTHRRVIRRTNGEVVPLDLSAEKVIEAAQFAFREFLEERLPENGAERMA
jgi:hypothetical protein